jgi:transposase-like protein
MDVLDEATLRRLYLDEGHPIAQIARTLHVRKQTICDALEHWHIARRPQGPRGMQPRPGPSLDPDTLRRLYLGEQQTIREIARALQAPPGAIRTALIRAGIARRRRGPRRDMRPLPESARQSLRSLVAVQGIPGAARYLKTSPAVIHAMLGSRPLPRGTTPRVDDQAVRAAYDAGTAIAAIAGEWGCSERTIWRSLQRTCVRPVA